MNNTAVKVVKLIDLLKSKPFVHIISEKRTGSTSLYEILRGESQVFNLSEPFEQIKNTYSPDQVLTYINQNQNKCKVMKNHAFSLLNLKLSEQERLWNIPAFNVGLSRRDWFAQTCSIVLAEFTQNYSFPHSDKFIIPVDFFKEKFYHLIRCKNDLNQLSNHLHFLIYYEDIKFPESQSHRYLRSQISIENIEELRAVYFNLRERFSPKILSVAV